MSRMSSRAVFQPNEECSRAGPLTTKNMHDVIPASAGATGSILFSQLFAYPLRVSSEVEYRPHHGPPAFHRVEDAIRKDPAEQTVIVSIDYPMDAARYLQSLNIGPKASDKVITQPGLPGLLCVVEEESFVEIGLRIFRNLDRDHGLPKAPFTSSQSRSRASPFRTLTRRRSNNCFCSGEISDRSKRSRKSSQITSMIWILRSTGNVLTSSAVIGEPYRFSQGAANPFSPPLPNGSAHRWRPLRGCRIARAPGGAAIR